MRRVQRIRGGPGALAAKLSGPFQIEPIRALLLRLIFKVVCNEFIVEPVSNVIFTILFPDEKEMTGGNSAFVLLVFCKALGITPEDLAIRENDTPFLTFLDPAPAGFIYVAALVDTMDPSVPDDESGHAMSGFMSDGKPYVFDPDFGVAHQVDWRDTDSLSVSLPLHMRNDALWFVGQDINAHVELDSLRRVYLSATFLKMHNSPTQTRPGCYLHATHVPSNALTRVRPHRQVHPKQLIQAMLKDKSFRASVANIFASLDPIIDRQRTVYVEEEPFQCDEHGQCTITPKYAFRGGRRLRAKHL